MVDEPPWDSSCERICLYRESGADYHPGVVFLTWQDPRMCLDSLGLFYFSQSAAPLSWPDRQTLHPGDTRDYFWLIVATSNKSTHETCLYWHFPTNLSPTWVFLAETVLVVGFFSVSISSKKVTVEFDCLYFAIIHAHGLDVKTRRSSLLVDKLRYLKEFNSRNASRLMTRTRNIFFFNWLCKYFLSTLI